MKLQLTRPICAFDTETTGTKVDKDRIVEICIIKVHPDGKQESIAMFINPGISIPADATKTHHITDEMVKDKPTFKQVASTIADFIEGADLLGFNSNKFDIPLLVAEFERAGMPLNLNGVDFVDVSDIYREHNQRTLIAAVKQYCDRGIENAHSAQADTEATIELLDKLIDVHGDLVPLTVKELANKSTGGRPRLDMAGRFKYREDGVIIFTSGKNANDPVFKEKSYLKWMIDAKDQKTGNYIYTADTRKIANDLFFDLLPNIDAELLPPNKPTEQTRFGYTNVR